MTPARFVERLEELPIASPDRPKIVIATSGTAASLAAVCHALYKTRGPRATSVSGADAPHRQDARAAKPPATNQAAGDRTAARRVVIAGAVVYSSFWNGANLPAFVILRWDCDGLLEQMAAEYDLTRSVKHQSERWDSIHAAVSHYRVDMNRFAGT
jgi:hypothetical protein